MQDSPVDNHAVPLWEEALQGGAHWSGVVPRGRALRLTDIDGGANASVLLYSAQQPLERYNMADTLKAQHTARLTRGHVCYSDMGRILCSIVTDTCGWHDPLGALSNAAQVTARYGATRYQEQRNARYRNGVDSMLTELGKHGLGPRDLVAGINFFSKVSADESGRLHFQPGNSRAGDHVVLRFEMPAIVVVATAPHPLDPRPAYRPGRVALALQRAAQAAADDVCRTSCPENARGFVNTERAFA